MSPIQIGGTIAGLIIMIGWVYLVIRIAYPAVISHAQRKKHRVSYKRFMNRED